MVLTAWRWLHDTHGMAFRVADARRNLRHRCGRRCQLATTGDRGVQSDRGLFTYLGENIAGSARHGPAYGCERTNSHHFALALPTRSERPSRAAVAPATATAPQTGTGRRWATTSHTLFLLQQRRRGVQRRKLSTASLPLRLFPMIAVGGSCRLVRASMSLAERACAALMR